jgi:hypothetical protein
MTQKSALRFFGIFALIFLSLTFVSAVNCIDVTPVAVPDNVEHDIGIIDFSFNVTNIGGACADRTNVNITFNADKTGTFSPVALFGLAQGEEETINAQFNLDEGQTGSITITVNQDSDQAPDDPENLPSITINDKQFEFCEIGNPAGLKIEIKDMNVEEGFGDDENYWYPLDEIELEIEADNDGDWDVDDIELEICIYDNEENECVLDEGDMDIDDEKFDLDEDDDEKKILAKFNVDPKDLNEGNTDYTIYVKAEGKIDDSDAGDLDNEKSCISDSQDIEIRTDEKFVIIDKISAIDLTSPKEDGKVSCGSEVQITADVWNVGDDKIEEDKIFIWVYNKELDINEVVDMRDISSLDSEELSLLVNIPEDAAEKTYVIELSAYEDDDLDDDELYENDENDESEFRYIVDVVDCAPELKEPTITANLASEAKIGEDLIVQVSIVNNADTANFVISAVGYETWAELTDVSPRILTISKDDTAQATITLNPTKTGSQTFNIQVIYNGETIEQPVQINIAERAGFLTGAIAGLGDTGLYIIAGVVLILIIIIIVLIIKVAKSPTPAEF